MASSFSIPLFHSVFVNLLGLVSIGDLEPYLIMLIKPVSLEGIHGNGGLKGVLEINKTEEVLAVIGGRLSYQPDALEARERPEDVWVAENLRETSRSFVSLGTPST